MENLFRDCRYAWRSLRHNPGYALVAGLTLALGIGASVAIFTVVHGILFKTLPYENPDRIVLVEELDIDRGGRRIPLTAPEFRAFRDQNKVFEAMTIARPAKLNLIGEGQPERLDGVRVSDDFFRVMGAAPALGRAFLAEEDAPGGERTAVLSHALMKRRFADREKILDQVINLDGESYTVVGVMAPEFSSDWEIFVPIALDFEGGNRTSHYLPVRARLLPGVTVEQAEVNLQILAARLAESAPDTDDGRQPVVELLYERMVGGLRPALYILQAAVFLLLLIACTNVANLSLVRMATRNQEVALRTALGAGRKFLFRQFLVESLLLTVTGGLLGLILAFWSTRALLAFNDSIPRAEAIAIDGNVLLFALALILTTALIFGLLPIRGALKTNLVESLKEGSQGQVGQSGGRMYGVLVLAQVALTLVLLVGAGLLIRSFGKLVAVEPGFNPNNVLTVQIDLPRRKYDEDAKVKEFYRQVLDRFAGLPGVEDVGAVHPMPLTGGGYFRLFTVEGRPIPPTREQTPRSSVRFVAPGYFEVMEIPLKRGKTLTPRDDGQAEPVVVINERAAQHFWPDEDPLGQRVTFDHPLDEDKTWWTVTGIVGDVHREDLSVATAPEIYWSYLQSPFRITTVVLRMATDPMAVVGPLRQELAKIDPDLPMSRVRTLEEIVAQSVSQPRSYALALSLFAGLALVLATIGVYGLISYSVTLRQREIGVRLALGAQRTDVLSYVFRRGMVPVLLGLLLGLALAFAFNRSIASITYEVSTTDLGTFAAVTFLLIVVSLGACLIPALRATRIDPIQVLRAE